MERFIKAWRPNWHQTTPQPTAAGSGCLLCQAKTRQELYSFEFHIRGDHSALFDVTDIRKAFKRVLRQIARSQPSAQSPDVFATDAAVVHHDDWLDRRKDCAGQSEIDQHDKEICLSSAPVAQLRSSSPGASADSRASSDLSDHSETASEPASVTEIIRQPETRPVTLEQLVAEAKASDAGLCVIEAKCIEYDGMQETELLGQGQYQALVTLHNSLLGWYYDFFAASWHPSADEDLHRLAPRDRAVRMRKHGMRDFLERLRHRLPDTADHMRTFINHTYSIMTLLCREVPAFKDIWTECLGNLSEYRVLIEDNIDDKKVWTASARSWYGMAADTAPTVGRHYHRLANLVLSNALQRLYLYSKSLCVPSPFLGARESIRTLFDPFLAGSSEGLDPVDAAFVRVHGIFFTGECKEQLQTSIGEFLELLDNRIEHQDSFLWLEKGYYLSISLCCLMLDFGSESNVLTQALTGRRTNERVGNESTQKIHWDPEEKFNEAVYVAVRACEVIIRRLGDTNTLSFVHTMLAFMHRVSQLSAAMSHLENEFPWGLTCKMLNYLVGMTVTEPRISTEVLPGLDKPEKGFMPLPLPEDYALRGLLFTEHTFPNGWFDNSNLDEAERYMESERRTLNREQRLERILWLGRRIASNGKGLTWDAKRRHFEEVRPSLSRSMAMRFGGVSARGTQESYPRRVQGWFRSCLCYDKAALS